MCSCATNLYCCQLAFLLSFVILLGYVDSYSHRAAATLSPINTRLNKVLLSDRNQAQWRDHPIFQPVAIKSNSNYIRSCASTSLLAVKESNELIEASTYKDDVKITLAWVGSAIAFAGFIASTKGLTSAVEFASGYVLEQSLSIDNLFVFLVLFDYFQVPKQFQERVLQYGLLGAAVLRAIFIGVGSIVLQEFHQVLLFFAVILLVSSYKILAGNDDEEEEDLSDNAIVKLAKKYFKASDKFDGSNFFTYENGERLATPLLLCMVCLELSDVVFALDSVPAVFGVTEDPFIVFTSNIFAIGSLRALFGVLSKAVSQLEYLEKAVGVVLGVIAVKMGLEVYGYEILTPFQSLAVVLSILSTGIVASLLKPKQEVPDELQA